MTTVDSAPSKPKRFLEVRRESELKMRLSRAQCQHGENSHRCKARCLSDRMLCPEHLTEALARVRAMQPRAGAGAG